MQVNKVYQGDNLKVLKKFPDNTFGSIVTDPPYGWEFMNNKWDYDIPSVELWKECLRVLKPGGWIIVACGTKTQHRMAVNIEDAGFEIRDVIPWHYGEGFPKSTNVALEIDKKLGVESKVIGTAKMHDFSKHDGSMMNASTTPNNKYEQTVVAQKEATSEEAKEWDGYGTALKPATELWTLARKPLEGDTIADNVLIYGVGGLNIDACRVPFQEGEKIKSQTMPDLDDVGKKQKALGNGHRMTFGQISNAARLEYEPSDKGRWPSNVIHDGSDEIIRHFPKDTDRFFYVAKPSKSERDNGLYEFDKVEITDGSKRSNPVTADKYGANPVARKNYHPTVKPFELMKYLIKLVTPKKEVCLDPYLGSGTTAVACKSLKIKYVGIEREKEYVKIAEARIKAEVVQYDIFDFLGEEDE